MTDYPVPPISQRTVKLCWEACGHMLWDWRYRDDAGMRARYAQTAGHYTSLDTGLAAAQMDKFYRRLGLRSLWKAKGANVRYALQWSPVIVTSVLEQRGHAMVVAGTNIRIYILDNGTLMGDKSTHEHDIPATRVQRRDRSPRSS